MTSYRAYVHVRLTAQEADHADDVAARIHAGAGRHGRRDARGEARLRSNQVGCRGELAFAKWSGVEWRPSFTPQGRAPDVGPYEIKTSSMLAPSHDDALWLPADRLVRSRVYVAVLAWNRYDHELIGWTTGAHAQDVFVAVEKFRRLHHVLPYGVLWELGDLP